jgi:hypothetical protein
LILNQLNDGKNHTAPGGDTGAASRAKRLSSAAEWHLADGIDQPIPAFIQRVRQQMRVPGDFPMNVLQTRLYERIHETREKVFARRSGFCALGVFGSGNSGSAISDGNHCISPSKITASANVMILAADYRSAI